MATGSWFKQHVRKKPYDVYLCRDPAWITELKKMRQSRLVSDKVMLTSLHISELADRIRAQEGFPLIPVVPPKPKNWFGRIVDWACRAVK